MATIINGTLQSINLYNISQVNLIEEEYIVIPGQLPVQNIPAGTMQLNARITTATPLSLDVSFELVGDRIFASYDAIPAGDLIIVTPIYKNAVRALGGNTANLAVPWQPVLGEIQYGQGTYGAQNLIVKGFLGLATG